MSLSLWFGFRRNKSRCVKPAKRRRRTSFRPLIEALEKRELLSVTSEVFVKQLYRDLLGREADPGGLAGWSGLIDQGHPRSEVVQGIEGTLEYQDRLVTGFYNSLLLRAPDPGGEAGWAAALAADSTVEQVKTAFLASTEYFQNRGGSTNSGFLTAVYNDVLNRPVDPVGAAGWGAILNSGHAPNGGDPRTFVAFSILTSTEGSQDLVQSFYQRFLHRSADLVGLMGWAGLIENGTGSGVVIVGIVGSNEYYQLAVPPIVIATPANGGIDTQNVEIAGQVSLDRVSGLAAAVDSSTFTNVLFDASGNFSFTTNLALNGSADGDHVVHFQSTDSMGHVSAAVNVTFTLNTRPGAVAAPGVDMSVATTAAASTQFLYTGSNPIQTGVAPGTINPVRAAAIRGHVTNATSNPLAGVAITILNHPEFGTTQTRADGMFDMAVNGGGTLTVRYVKDGFLMVQRQVAVPWQDYARVPDVVMTAVDPNVTAIDLTSSAPIQVARGSVETDANGSRQATLFFPQGVQATMTLPNGTTQNLTTLHVRATEYTVGTATTGLHAMPGTLPADVAYAYSFELNSDEAVAAGATETTFSQPLPFYVENFLNLPVGIAVPLGSYDRGADLWHDMPNGRIVKILSVTGGMADLDIDGSGNPASGPALATLGITGAERTQLAQTYQIGQTLWRMSIPHFTLPFDT
jgi:hypothetical protein